MNTSPISNQLRLVRREFAEFRHGGVVLSSEDAECFVKRLDGIILDALNLEAAAELRRWNKESAQERDRLITPRSVVVLNAFRNDPKIVPLFPGRGPNHPHSRS
ncbi:Hypothetical protein NGAL_HAMBI1145_09530 [Neorhizobium galegae bv. officinalis]|uniref:Uncharacterized protein n=1 Tax=Neorhizobium galegae bv. officinalis TaxID=323656 RepID=A0A0T7FAY8_NEOGA|nr:hypothetical protein [Neorhizobium galegae]CDZ32182.1 Hypothetical protein NGAL_HAMBI1145_09530 [Neorhizobium galegae bv. officinalis]